MKPVTWILAAVGFLMFMVQCGNDNIAGNASQTGNARGHLVMADGTPAAGVTVRFFPVDNAPRQVAKRMAGMDLSAEALAKADSVTTNSDGNFGIDLDSGTYNMLAATDSTAAFTDSVTTGVDTTIVDTMKVPGSLRAKVQLQGSDDPRTVFVLVMGTNVWAGPDAAGDFSLANMAEGTYNVRILTTLDLYEPLDTVLAIRSAVADTLATPIQLKYTGIPVPTGLTIQYDTLKQIVTLSWDKPTTGRTVAGYSVYRKRGDSISFTKIAASIADTMYMDSLNAQDQSFVYKVATFDTNGTEGIQSSSVNIISITAFSLIDSTGGQGNGDGQFNEISGLVILNKGKIVTADFMNHNVQIFDSARSFILKFGQFGTQNGAFSNPINITKDDSNNIYVLEMLGLGRVQRFDSSGVFEKAWTVGQYCRGITYYSGKIVIGSTSPKAIKTIHLQNDSITSIGLSTIEPFGIRYDKASSSFLIADNINNRIVRIDTAGTMLNAWGSLGSGIGKFSGPTYLLLAENGNVYVSDQGNKRVQVFDASGQFIAVCGAGILVRPAGLDLDSNGNLYVADKLLVRKFQVRL